MTPIQSKTIKMAADKEERLQEIREHLKQEMKTQMASLVSQIEDNNEKIEILQGTLVAQMDSHQDMKFAMHFIRSELDETTQHRTENVMT